MVVLLFVTGAPALFADGKVFRSAVVADPLTTPDQRALLHFSNGVERLVIETSLVGSGTNFAWVVPLPTEPRIEFVSTNLFKNLDRAFQPTIVHESSPAWIFVLLLWIMLSVGLWAHRQRIAFLRSLLILAMFFLFIILALPSFVRARRGGGYQASEVDVRNRARVGIYDTVVIKGENGRSLIDWLNREGFFTPTNAVSVIEDYAARGWVFAAAKLHRRESDANEHRPHPLAFTFQTSEPIYPLRLTGIDNGDCSIELFIFGDARAHADRFRTEFCGMVRPYEQRTDVAIGAPPRFSIGNAEVQRFALPAQVGTKLSGKLSPDDMKSDLKLEWVSFEEIVPTVYGRKAATTRAFGWFTAVAASGLLLLQIVGPRLRRQELRRRLITVVFGLALAGGIAFYISLDVRQIRTTAAGRNSAMSFYLQFAGAIEQFALERRSTKPLTFEELTRQVPDYIRGRPKLTNIFTGELMKNEASAGNLILQAESNQVNVVWFDIYGDPHRLGVFTNSPSQPTHP